MIIITKPDGCQKTAKMALTCKIGILLLLFIQCFWPVHVSLGCDDVESVQRVQLNEDVPDVTTKAEGSILEDLKLTRNDAETPPDDKQEAGDINPPETETPTSTESTNTISSSEQILREIFHFDMDASSKQCKVPVWSAKIGGLNSSEGAAYINGSDEDRVNATHDRNMRPKINCIGRNITSNESNLVRIINSTELLQRLSFKNESLGTCVVVMFYAPWCRFCASTAPVYNALARAFPQLDTLAIDAVHFSSLNARFGTIAVPNILVFHNAKAVARFNHTERTFPVLKSFIQNVTGLQANDSIIVEEMDFDGPVPSQPTHGPDYLLWVAWIFVIVVSGVMFSRSSSGQRLWTFINSLGHEPHQHID